MNAYNPGSGAWGVLLAGGDEPHLRCLTTLIAGDARPKQFCRILGEKSLLTQTRHRISPLFDTGRVIAIVTRKHEAFYSRELDDWTRTSKCLWLICP